MILNEPTDTQEHTPSITQLHLQSNSPFTPRRNLCRELDLYIDSLETSVPNLVNTDTCRKFRPNLTRNELLALSQLSNTQDIVIRPADKGGAIVILDKSEYIREGLRQLQDE